MNIGDALSHRTIIAETRTRNVAENGVHQFVANTAELKAMKGEESEATSGVDDVREPATMYQNRKLGECKLFRLQVSQRWTLYFWKYGPKSRNKNSGTKEIWSKSNWVRSWRHQGILRMKQRCGDQNLIRKPRSFAKHVMGDKLGVENLPHDWGASRILARNCDSFHESIASGDYVFAVTDYYSRYVKISILTRNTAKVAIRSLSKMFAIHGFPYTVTSDTSSHFCGRIVWNLPNGQRN